MHNMYSKGTGYDLVESTIQLEGADVVTFGISCAEQKTVNGITMEATYIIRDISEDREWVARIVRRLNELEVEAVHMADVVSDMLLAG